MLDSARRLLPQAFQDRGADEHALIANVGPRIVRTGDQLPDCLLRFSAEGTVQFRCGNLFFLLHNYLASTDEPHDLQLRACRRSPSIPNPACARCPDSAPPPRAPGRFPETRAIRPRSALPERVAAFRLPQFQSLLFRHFPFGEIDTSFRRSLYSIVTTHTLTDAPKSYTQIYFPVLVQIAIAIAARGRTDRRFDAARQARAQPAEGYAVRIRHGAGRLGARNASASSSTWWG